MMEKIYLATIYIWHKNGKIKNKEDIFTPSNIAGFENLFKKIFNEDYLVDFEQKVIYRSDLDKRQYKNRDIREWAFK